MYGFVPTLGNSFQLIATTAGRTITWSGTLDAFGFVIERDGAGDLVLDFIPAGS